MKILVTGGASGLGEAIVRALAADQNHTILFTYYKSSENAARIVSEKSNTEGISCNFSDEESLNRLLARIDQEDIDILINNAMAGMHKEHFHKIPTNIFTTSFQTNVLPTLRVTQEAIHTFRKKKFGKIITILSAAIMNKPPIGWSEYVANKSYLLSMSKSWATENAKFNITSNCISPSFMLTNLTSDTDERIIEQMIANHPFKKLLTPVEVAKSVTFLVHSSQQINGTNLVINAGENL